LQQFPEHYLGRRCQVLAIAERLELFHVGALAQLQLHRMNVLGRIAVVPGDVAALEATVQHMAVIAVTRADRLQLGGQLRIATGAVEGAKVEVRQFAVEQMRDDRADRVRIEQQRIAEFVF
jgi:hypothetical protein